jgi:threonine synthase
MFSTFAHLICTRCGAQYERDRRVNVCPACGAALFARYHAITLERDAVRDRTRTIWRWHEMMPVEDPGNIVTLGEGGTPMLPAPRLAAPEGFSDLWIKDEAGNPTGSFKARGLSAAISKAKELGHGKIALPTAGNAGGAAAAYAAKAGMECHVFMPEDTPPVFRIECERYGAKVTLVKGLIDDCGRIVAERAPREGWHDVSTLKEPFRVEGKKTMGYELAEDFGWTLPDAILYPTGGGTGLIGMWKAFEEMEELGWIGGKRPKMFAIRPRAARRSRRPSPRAKSVCEVPQRAHVRLRLRVPPFADYLILRYVRDSGGAASRHGRRDAPRRR